MKEKMKKTLLGFLFLLIAVGGFRLSEITVRADSVHYLRPYQTENVTVHDGDAEESFTMMGVKFTHGLTTDDWRDDRYAVFNLDGKVSSVSFVIGHLDGDRNDSGQMKIYLDGIIQETYTKELTSDMINQTVTISVTGIKQLEIYVSGYHARYGIGNLTETGAHNYECSITKVATVSEAGVLTYICRDCGDTYTEVDPAKTVCTNYILPYQKDSMDEWNESFGSADYAAVMGKKYYQAFSSSDWRDTSNVFYNLNSSYRSVTFRVGHRDNNRNWDNGVLNVYMDGTLVKTVDLTPTMLVQDISLNTSAVTQLKIEITGYHAVYVIFDINAIPVTNVNRQHSFVDETLVEAEFGVPGTIRHVCSVCGAYYTTSLPALQRNMRDKELSVSLDQTEYSYNGKAKTPKVTVKYGDTVLIQNVDYTLSYKNNVNPGIASVVVNGKGGYTGTSSKTYTIYPKKVSLSSLKSKKKKQITVKWKKDNLVTGYEIQYSTSSYFYSYYTKTKTVKKKNSVTIKGLSRKTIYYVKIRSYKTVNGKKYYSDYSKVKKVKVK